MKIIKEYNSNYIDFSKIIEAHLSKDDTKLKIRLFHILDAIFKSELGELYLKELAKHIYKNFKECYTMGDFEERVLLFKIFYTWKYVIPKDLYKLIEKETKIDDFKEIFMKKFPGGINKYDDWNNNNREKYANRFTDKKAIPKEDEDDKNVNNNNILSINPPKKVKTKKLIGKKNKISS